MELLASEHNHGCHYVSKCIRQNHLTVCKKSFLGDRLASFLPPTMNASHWLNPISAKWHICFTFTNVINLCWHSLYTIRSKGNRYEQLRCDLKIRWGNRWTLDSFKPLLFTLSTHTNTHTHKRLYKHSLLTLEGTQEVGGKKGLMWKTVVIYSLRQWWQRVQFRKTRGLNQYI